MKKIIIPMFVLSLLLCLSLSVGAASLSPALSVIRSGMRMVKTGVGENSVSFCANDFESFIGTDVSTVKIISVPDALQGKLMLGADEVSAGAEIPSEKLAALRFVPAGEGVTASFSFSPQTDGEAFICAVSMLSSLDFSPDVSDVSASAIENISYSGKLSASDPEGDDVSFIIIKGARHGKVVLDAQNGEYVYCPENDFVGRDRFTYAAKDEYGNISESAQVSIDVDRNKSGIVYADMDGRKEYTAAVSVGENNVIVGEVIGGQRFFYPEKTVSRGDFLVMAMDASGLEPISAENTGFADDESLSPYIKGYVAAAVKAGVIFGIENENGRSFMAGEPVTVSQAATIVSRLMSLAKPVFADSLPVLATQNEEISDDGLAAMSALGFFDGQKASDILTRASAAVLLCRMLE